MSGTEHPLIPCPFVYTTGKQCAGHIIRVEAYKADISSPKDTKIYMSSVGP